MIYITQLVYIKAGHQETFNAFEAAVIPLIAKHNGRLLLRIRPEQNQIIQTSIQHPYELHLVSFASEVDFEEFKQDKDRENFLHLKEKSIERIILMEGKEIL